MKRFKASTPTSKSKASTPTLRKKPFAHASRKAPPSNPTFGTKKSRTSSTAQVRKGMEVECCLAGRNTWLRAVVSMVDRKNAKVYLETHTGSRVDVRSASLNKDPEPKRNVWRMFVKKEPVAAKSHPEYKDMGSSKDNPLVLESESDAEAPSDDDEDVPIKQPKQTRPGKSDKDREASRKTRNWEKDLRGHDPRKNTNKSKNDNKSKSGPPAPRNNVASGRRKETGGRNKKRKPLQMPIPEENGDSFAEEDQGMAGRGASVKASNALQERTHESKHASKRQRRRQQQQSPREKENNRKNAQRESDANKQKRRVVVREKDRTPTGAELKPGTPTVKPSSKPTVAKKKKKEKTGIIRIHVKTPNADTSLGFKVKESGLTMKLYKHFKANYNEKVVHIRLEADGVKLDPEKTFQQQGVRDGDQLDLFLIRREVADEQQRALEREKKSRERQRQMDAKFRENLSRVALQKPSSAREDGENLNTVQESNFEQEGEGGDSVGVSATAKRRQPTTKALDTAPTPSPSGAKRWEGVISLEGDRQKFYGDALTPTSLDLMRHIPEELKVKEWTPLDNAWFYIENALIRRRCSRITMPILVLQVPFMVVPREQTPLERTMNAQFRKRQAGMLEIFDEDSIPIQIFFYAETTCSSHRKGHEMRVLECFLYHHVKPNAMYIFVISQPPRASRTLYRLRFPQGRTKEITLAAANHLDEDRASHRVEAVAKDTRAGGIETEAKAVDAQKDGAGQERSRLLSAGDATNRREEGDSGKRGGDAEPGRGIQEESSKEEKEGTEMRKEIEKVNGETGEKEGEVEGNEEQCMELEGEGAGKSDSERKEEVKASEIDRDKCEGEEAENEVTERRVMEAQESREGDELEYDKKDDTRAQLSIYQMEKTEGQEDEDTGNGEDDAYNSDVGDDAEENGNERTMDIDMEEKVTPNVDSEEGDFEADSYEVAASGTVAPAPKAIQIQREGATISCPVVAMVPDPLGKDVIQEALVYMPDLGIETIQTFNSA
eukprot:CAMPEP_0184478472 /NCGR_PEP_ID=MMETSP0113_2-20130426/491_1 /TAXON_ID=91329 /ORGANISM="Norrisiella sphaerica, Strain BC52" /LENGTH=1005 /DNA_ID=CAMNT_0026856277 /DNA_START=522 /DNA_END=3539 /DNA_ORIENTATION=+